MRTTVITALKRRLWDLRLLLLVLAALLLAPVFARPSIPVLKPALNYLFVIDITQSMNVRDYAIGARPVDRLTFAKSALLEIVHDLPCGSAAGLGLFTGWQTEILFDPIEVCLHRREIDDVIRHIDWRMTWAPQSNIARGLRDSLVKLESREDDASVVFFTDGDEAPDYGDTFMPPRAARQGQPRGVIVGMGDLRPSAVPLINQWGRMTGYFQRDGGPYLSSLKQDYLQKLGRVLRLDYHRLESSVAHPQLLKLLRSERYADAQPGRQDLSWAFGVGALGLLSGVYLVSPLSRRNHGRERP